MYITKKSIDWHLCGQLRQTTSASIQICISPHIKYSIYIYNEKSIYWHLFKYIPNLFSICNMFLDISVAMLLSCVDWKPHLNAHHSICGIPGIFRRLDCHSFCFSTIINRVKLMKLEWLLFTQPVQWASHTNPPIQYIELLRFVKWFIGISWSALLGPCRPTHFVWGLGLRFVTNSPKIKQKCARVLRPHK